MNIMGGFPIRKETEMNKEKLLSIAGDWAREMRIRKGLTCKEVGELYGRHATVIARFENGEINSLTYFIFAMTGFDPDFKEFVNQWCERSRNNGETNVD